MTPASVIIISLIPTHKRILLHQHAANLTHPWVVFFCQNALSNRTGVDTDELKLKMRKIDNEQLIDSNNPTKTYRQYRHAGKNMKKKLSNNLW